MGKFRSDRLLLGVIPLVLLLRPETPNTRMSSTSYLNSLEPSVQIVERVAAAKGISPEKLAPLYDIIDTDALNTLFRSERDSDAGIGHVQFQYEGHTIVVASDGGIELADYDT